MAWLASSISVNDLRMLSRLIYYEQGTEENCRAPHDLDICISPASPEGVVFFGLAGFS